MIIRNLLILCFIGAVCHADPDSDRIDWLRAEIARHNHLYWQELQPEISDEAYDDLVAEYIRISGHSPDLWTDQNTESARRSHRVPMLSLNKLHTKADWQAYLLSLERLTSIPTSSILFRLEPKYDGVAISLVYRNGHLQYALTRGDGREGLLVNSAVLLTASPPVFIADAAAIHKLEIRGELFANNHQFAHINEQRTSAGESPYAQPRHLVAATLRTHNLNTVAGRELSFVAFDAHADEGLCENTTQSGIIQQLKSWGFAVPILRWEESPAQQVMIHVEEFSGIRSQLSFPTDGLVIKIECRSLQKKLGATQRAPRWAVAWKYPGPQVESRILAIVYNTGESGRVTPVAQIVPVEIDGIRIERISLHSPTFKKQQGYEVGKRISVHLAGGVIPAIAGMLED